MRKRPGSRKSSRPRSNVSDKQGRGIGEPISRQRSWDPPGGALCLRAFWTCTSAVRAFGGTRAPSRSQSPGRYSTRWISPGDTARHAANELGIGYVSTREGVAGSRPSEPGIPILQRLSGVVVIHGSTDPASLQDITCEDNRGFHLLRHLACIGISLGPSPSMACWRGFHPRSVSATFRRMARQRTLECDGPNPVDGIG
jgi:hypothetical protein